MKYSMCLNERASNIWIFILLFTLIFAGAGSNDAIKINVSLQWIAGFSSNLGLNIINRFGRHLQAIVGT